MTWDDVFQDFKLKNQYVLGKLKFDKAQIQKEIEDAKNDAKRAIELTQKILETQSCI